MLVSTVIDDVRSNLNDLGVTFYTQTDILDSVQDSCDQVTIRSGLIEATFDVPFQAQVGYYDLSAVIGNFYTVTQIYNNQTRQWLTPLTTSDYDSMRDDWELWNGAPQFFTPIDYKRVVVVPRPPATNGSMKVYYKAISPTLTPATTLPFPANVTRVPEHYATADLLEQAREYGKAKVAWDASNEMLELAVKRTQVRALPALIYRFREMRYGN